MPPKKAATAVPSATTMDPTVQLQQAEIIRFSMESSIRSLQQRLTELGKDVDMLRDTRAEIARDAREYMDYSVQELKRKDNEITTLKSDLLRMELNYEGKLQQAATMTEEALKEMEKRYETLETDSQKEIKDRDMKLERARQFLELRDQYEQQIETLTKQYEELQERAKNAEADAERRWIVEKKLLERAQEEHYAELKRQAKVEVLKAMDEDTVRLIKDSKLMSKELTLTSSECRILIDERTILSDTNQTLQRDLALLKEAEKEWAVRNAAKESTNKELDNRCKELEMALLAERKARLTEYSALLNRVQSETEDMRLELTGLKSLMALKNRELRTIKKLAQIILQQRTEVEQFFLDALTQVKLDIARRKSDAIEATKALSIPQPIDLKPILVTPHPSNVGSSPGHGGMYQKYPSPSAVFSPNKQHKPTNNGSVDISNTSSMSLYVTVSNEKSVNTNVTLPDLTSTARRASPGGVISPNPPAISSLIASAAVSSTTVKNSKVDIGELTPEDRERVLRLLFAKINNLDNASRSSRSHYRHNHPQHNSSSQPQQPSSSSNEIQIPSGNHSPSNYQYQQTNERKQYEEERNYSSGGKKDSSLYSSPSPYTMDQEFSSLNSSPLPTKESNDNDEDEEIDTEELAAALGAKAQERVKLSSALRKEG